MDVNQHSSWKNKNSGKSSSVRGGSDWSARSIDLMGKKFRVYSCSYCSYTSHYKSHVQAHLRTHTGERPFVCDICKKGFTQKHSLLSHKLLHTGFELSCDPIQTYTDEMSLKSRKGCYRLHNCDYCSYSSFKKCDVVRHMRTHTGERPFSCDICGKKFTQKHNLMSHVVSHNKEQPFICKVCGKGTWINCADIYSVSNVNIPDVNKTVRSYSCKKCPYQTHEKTNISRHVRTHTGERPFVCPTCGKLFSRNDNLKIHMVKHSCLHLLTLGAEHSESELHIRKANGRHYCVICSYSSAYKTDIRRHVRKHTGERPYTCSACGKAFARKQTLRLHMVIHSRL
ncbi:gastrula zinc finger protein XlCGF8.2DB-like [Uloborus diversus]|uniref:gastrula zinc finger protein XlCGF8.2DB-like n=1 Tax=Uloborus diversus TaxID=327109 RepID=UPI00240A757A|nr:gastrula zinc finger protein XlCGF8.2DB-like [Uloborus diversus]